MTAPWALVSQPDETDFKRAVQTLLLRAAKDEFWSNPLPVLPTEDGWAAEIRDYCEWRQPHLA